MWGSEFTETRLMFGTRLVRSQTHVKCCKGSRRFRTLTQVWRGSEVPTTMQGMKVLGTSLGHPDHVASHLSAMTRKHGVLLEAIPNVVDVQCAWLLLVHCASARANYSLRVVRPEWVHHFAVDHDIRICGSVSAQSSKSRWMAAGSQQGTQPRCFGCWVDLACSTQRSSVAAYWASWADALPMIQERHPAKWPTRSHIDWKGFLVHHVWVSASRVVASLDGVRGWEVPSWSDFAAGLRPQFREPEAHELGCCSWQHEAASRDEEEFHDSLFPDVSPSRQALLR